MPSEFEHQPNALAEWYNIIQFAQQQSGYDLEESLEHYLILTLDSFTTRTDLGSNIIAVDFLQYCDAQCSFDINCLRNTGDQCLILSGLFPERMQTKNIPGEYLINIGTSAYDIISKIKNFRVFDKDLFAKLRDNFMGLITTLQFIRTAHI